MRTDVGRDPIVNINGVLRVLNRGEVGPLHGVVRLEDVSAIDAPARVLATAPVVLAGGETEMRFQLVVDRPPDAAGAYLLSARLEGEDLRTRRRQNLGTSTAHPWRVENRGDAVIELDPWT